MAYISNGRVVIALIKPSGSNLVSEGLAESTTVTAPRIAMMIPRKSRYSDRRRVNGSFQSFNLERTNLPEPLLEHEWREYTVCNQRELGSRT